VKNLNQQQIKRLSEIAVNNAISVALTEVGDIVRAELPGLVKPVIEPAVVARRYAVYTEAPRKPFSNYTQILLAVASWKRGRGECLGSIWLHKPENNKEFCFIEQYGTECVLSSMDKSQPSADLELHTSRILKPGKSIWTDWTAIKGVIEYVVAKQKAKGWVVYQPEPKQQLSLVDAV